MKFRCSRCGQFHDLSEISFGTDAPIQWHLLSEPERENSELCEEQCVIESADGRHFFIRTCLDIPIQNSSASFTWGVWVSLSEESFLEMAAHWDDPARTSCGPYFGWLCTKVPEYPDTVFLKTRVHQRPVGTRPRVELEPTDHPLALHQREGISQALLSRIVMNVLHAED